jgi:hypothetical protein
MDGTCTSSIKITWKRELLIAIEFMNVNRERQVCGNTTESLNNIGGSNWTINSERFCTSSVRDHEKNSW